MTTMNYIRIRRSQGDDQLLGEGRERQDTPGRQGRIDPTRAGRLDEDIASAVGGGDVGYLPKSVIADPALLSAIFKNSFKMSCPI